MGFLASIIGRVELDGGGFVRGAQQVERTANAMATNVTNRFRNMAAGFLTAGTVLSFVRKTVDYASKVNDLSDRLGVSAERLQELGFAAKQNGGSLEKLAEFLERINVSREEALSGSKSGGERLESFQRLGVSKQDLKTKRADELTGIIGNTVKAGDVEKLIAPLKEVGGKGASTLVAAFKAGLEQEAAKAREAGVVFSTEELDKLGDKLEELSLRLSAGLAPVIVAVGEQIVKTVNRIRIASAYLGGLTSTLDVGEVLRKGNLPGPAPLKAFFAMSELGKQLGAASVEADKAAQAVKAQVAAEEEAARKAAANQPNFSANFDETNPVDKAKTSVEKMSVDQLNRIGGFVGGAEIVIVAVQKEIARNTAKTARLLEDIRRPERAGYPEGSVIV